MILLFKMLIGNHGLHSPSTEKIEIRNNFLRVREIKLTTIFKVNFLFEFVNLDLPFPLIYLDWNVVVLQ